MTPLTDASVPAPEGGHVTLDGDASALPGTLRAGTFDVVLSIAAFEHIADLPQALRQAREALRPEGTLLAQVGPVWTGWRGHYVFAEYFGGDRDKTWLEGRYGAGFARDRLTFSDYGRAFTAAGFEQVDMVVNGAPAPQEWRRALTPALREVCRGESRFDVDCFWVTLRRPR